MNIETRHEGIAGGAGPLAPPRDAAATEFKALCEAMAFLDAEQQPTNVLRALVAQAASLIRTEHVRCTLFDAGLKPLAQWPVGAGFSHAADRAAIRRSENLVRRTSLAHRVNDPIPDAPGRGGQLRSRLSLPVPDRDGRCLGVLTLCNSGRRGGFNQRDEQLMAALARHAGMVLRCTLDGMARQTAETERLERQREVGALLQAVAQLAGLAPTEEVLIRIVDVAADLMDVVRASFVSNEGDHAQSRSRRVAGHWETWPVRLPLDGSINGWVIRHARPYRSTDLSQDPLFYLRGTPQAYQFRTLLSVPVLGRNGRVLGVLNLHDRRDGRPFSDADLRLAEGLAHHAALALERAALLTELRRGEAHYRLLVENLNDIVFAVTVDDDASSGTIEVLGGPVEEITGYPRAAFTADAGLWQCLVHPDDLAAFASATHRCIASKTPELRTYRLRHATTDEDRWIEDKLVVRRDANGAVIGLFGVARDITARKQVELQLQHLASHDALTALFNRRRFSEELERELALVRRHGTPGALLFLDLDGFKAVNDRHGHRAGDEVLASLGQMLRSQLRDGDILARLGGDEFAILLPRTGETEALAMAARLREAMRRHTTPIGGKQIAVSASIGIAPFPALGTSAEELLACADLAMYRAKTHRDHVYLYRASPAGAKSLAPACNWERRLRTALDQDLFVLHAQPIEDLRTGQRQYELLLRLIARDGRLCEPESFLPVAERSGLMGEIDRWVVLQAIYLLSREAKKPATLRVCANLSSMALNDTALLALIQRELERTNIDPRRLMFEITETAAIADLAGAQRFVRALKRLGCRFALDDFGVGFSSFYYLKHLPVDVLKIEGGFVRNLARDETDLHVVRGIVTVAQGLGKETIAEYVEDSETVAVLRQLGVDHAQGYQIGRPGPLADIR